MKKTRLALALPFALAWAAALLATPGCKRTTASSTGARAPASASVAAASASTSNALTTSASAGAAASAAASTTLECQPHGLGKVWRLKGKSGKENVEATAIVIGSTLRLTIATDLLRTGGYFEGPIDANGGFDLQRPKRTKEQAMRSVKGTLDAAGKLTCLAQVAEDGRLLQLALQGTEDPPATGPTFREGYSVTTFSEGGEDQETPVAYRGVDYGLLLVGMAPGLVTMVTQTSNSAEGGCQPGTVHTFTKQDDASRAQIMARAAELTAGHQILASEVFHWTCGRAWLRTQVLLLVEKDGQREVMNIQVQDHMVAYSEIAWRTPWPPPGCR